MRKKSKGFTLAELLIVTAIIGILVGISIPVFSAQLKKARFAANQANARSALSAAMTLFLDAPEKDKETTITNQNQHMYFRYDTATGQCTYRGVSTISPNAGKKEYKNFANVGYQQGGGKGISNVSQWTLTTSSKLMNGTFSDTVLTDRTYKYWDVAMQGDGTFLAIVCLW